MSKKRIPFFKFYPSDFMNGVRGLSAQEVGVYTMILCRIYEESGPIEYIPIRLSTYCGMREKTFIQVAEKLIALGKIYVENGMIFNERAGIEIQSRANDLENNSKAGKASAQKRQQNQWKNSTDVQQSFNHTDTDTYTSNSLCSLDVSKAEKKPKKNGGLKEFKSILSQHMSEGLLNDFITHRRSKKASNTETSANMFLKAANDAGLTPAQAAEIAIDRNWTTVKREWMNNSGRNNSKPMTIAGAAAQALEDMRMRNGQAGNYNMEQQSGIGRSGDRTPRLINSFTEPFIPK